MNHQPESSIAVHEAAVRHQRRVWGLGLLFVGLHIGYVAFPLLPVAGTQAWLPWMALLPPLFACGYAVVVIRMLWRWRRAHATAHAFIAIPAKDEVSS
jgi:hypothetical protein